MDARTLTSQIEGSLVRERLLAHLSGFLGALAMLLACVGIYGVVAYGVTRRTSEIGVRMALGAVPGDVVRKVLREMMLLALFGIVIGLPVALWLTRMTRSFLFGLQPNDPAVLAAAGTSLLLVCALQMLMGAWRRCTSKWVAIVQSLTEISQAITAAGPNARDFSNQALAYYHLEDYAESTKAARWALRLDPNYNPAQFVPGATLAIDKRTMAESVSHLERAARTIMSAKAILVIVERVSPVQVHGEELDGQTDVWAAGVVLGWPIFV